MLYIGTLYLCQGLHKHEGTCVMSIVIDMYDNSELLYHLNTFNMPR